MGETAKRMIGIKATAAAAARITMLINNPGVEPVGCDHQANVPARRRTPMAEPSAMINPIHLLRRRFITGDFLDMSMFPWSGDAGPTPSRLVFAPLCVTHHLIELKTAHIPLLFSKPARDGKRSE
jgi:hypothetical protein